MADIARDSHYVPQATLRRWSGPDGCVAAYRTLVSHESVPEWERHAVKGVVWQRDFYTTFDGDQEGDAFERFLAREIEEPGQAAIETLPARGRMRPEDWKSIARFVAAQQMRTPLYFVEWVRRTNEHIPAALEGTIREVCEGMGKGEDQEQPRTSYTDDHLRVRLRVPGGQGEQVSVTAEVSSSRALWIASMRHLLTKRLDVIGAHRWRAAEPYGDADWPLTDHPLLTLYYYGPGRYDFGAGWARHGSTFVLPVSPKIAVYTEIGSRKTGAFVFSAEQTREVQEIMVRRALRWIIARSPLSWLRDVRPRVVNAMAYRTEQASWRSWHLLHSTNEINFLRGRHQANSQGRAADL